MQSLSSKKITVIGGCGHVGLPLGVKLAQAGARAYLLDTNETVVERVNQGRFPFLERDGAAQLQQVVNRRLWATCDPQVCAGSDVYVIVTGTPVDGHLNPRLKDITQIFSQYRPLFTPGCLVIMRSTLFPGSMNLIHRLIQEWGQDIQLAFCPERVTQGYALEEIACLPQFVAAFDEASFQAAYQIFAAIAPSIIRLTPLEAELCKLMTNSWRYLEFAIANQFYVIAETNGVNFYHIYDAMKYNYPRADGYKSAGFTAGPCLFKDTMQLAAYINHQFFLGHAAMLVNEGLANFVMEKTKRLFQGTLVGHTVGLLGMAFKAENDDTRDSLSFKIKKILDYEGARVLYHDPYIVCPHSLEEILQQAEALILGTPHQAYRSLSFQQPMVDVWGFYQREPIQIYPGYAS